MRCLSLISLGQKHQNILWHVWHRLSSISLHFFQWVPKVFSRFLRWFIMPLQCSVICSNICFGLPCLSMISARASRFEKKRKRRKALLWCVCLTCCLLKIVWFAACRSLPSIVSNSPNCFAAPWLLYLICTNTLTPLYFEFVHWIVQSLKRNNKTLPFCISFVYCHWCLESPLGYFLVVCLTMPQTIKPDQSLLQ